MDDYIKRLNLLLQFNGRAILDNPGKVSREVAAKFALSEFEKYRIIQESRITSDYDIFIKNANLDILPNVKKVKKK